MKNPIKSLNRNSLLLLVAIASITFVTVLVYALNRPAKKVAKPPEKAIVHEKGERIEFKPGSPGLELVKSRTVGGGGEFVSLESPARIIAATTSSVSSGGKIVIFESAELNDLYVGFVHARNEVYRSRKNLSRIQDMFKHRVATEKDLVEAETSLGNDTAQLAEFEGKLRAQGLDPNKLGNAGNNIAWVICDIPESQIENLKKGRKVKINFNSSPGTDWVGTAQAIGDNVDPITRTAKVRIEIINKHKDLKPGMFGVVRFPEQIAGNTVVLPYTSIVTVEGTNYVFVEETPLNFHKRQVTLGVSTKESVNITEGVTPGERVVVEGSILLKGLSFGF
ncbi:efflux RND transporter periplasmic adaptor subunit [Leptospira perdikensis]|uniref:HlyD family efflux transporter periplasmic adaptor subunit n=1 Tax=Leptospira perdikensis TaxID=2484948 RepID=A0A4R9JKE3_9LEPT|nr:efflux RND transporter periplasmic adaptor subunit [Leptospira perdikensis]TGL44748.1 HlyD family efflux transporter periplasmic adaptor subunit [Leptospira perdikensis]